LESHLNDDFEIKDHVGTKKDHSMEIQRIKESVSYTYLKGNTLRNFLIDLTWVITRDLISSPTYISLTKKRGWLQTISNPYAAYFKLSFESSLFMRRRVRKCLMCLIIVLSVVSCMLWYAVDLIFHMQLIGLWVIMSR